MHEVQAAVLLEFSTNVERKNDRAATAPLQEVRDRRVRQLQQGPKLYSAVRIRIRGSGLSRVLPLHQRARPRANCHLSRFQTLGCVDQHRQRPMLDGHLRKRPQHQVMGLEGSCDAIIGVVKTQQILRM